MAKYSLSVIFLISFLFACHCEKKLVNKNFSHLNIRKIAKQKYGDNYKLAYNKSREYVLITHREKNTLKIIPDLSFFVYSLDKAKTVFSDTLNSGNVFWSGDTTIKAIEYDNKAETTIKNTYIYDVKSQRYIVKTPD